MREKLNREYTSLIEKETGFKVFGIEESLDDFAIYFDVTFKYRGDIHDFTVTGDGPIVSDEAMVNLPVRFNLSEIPKSSIHSYFVSKIISDIKNYRPYE